MTEKNDRGRKCVWCKTTDGGPKEPGNWFCSDTCELKWQTAGGSYVITGDSDWDGVAT